MRKRAKQIKRFLHPSFSVVQKSLETVPSRGSRCLHDFNVGLSESLMNLRRYTNQKALSRNAAAMAKKKQFTKVPSRAFCGCRPSLSSTFRGIRRLRSKLEWYISSQLRLQGKLERPFRAICSPRTGFDDSCGGSSSQAEQFGPGACKPP